MRLVTLAAALIAFAPVAALNAQPGSHAGRQPHGPAARPGHGAYHRPEPHGPRAHGHRHRVCRSVWHNHHRVQRCSYR